MLLLVRTPLLAALAAAAFTALGCASSSEEEGKQSRRIELRAEEYRFTPSEIRASPGERISVVLDNNGKKEHGLAFDLPGVNPSIARPVEPGGTGSVTFTTPNSFGRYAFFSPTGDDRRLGMQGTLIIEGRGSTPR